MKWIDQVWKMTVVLVLFACGCGDAGPDGDSDGGDDGRPVVVATNYPLSYFAQRIAGDTAEVRLPAIEGDPAFWRPSDEEVTELQRADLILMNGATYEKWAGTVSLPASKTIDTSASFADAYIEIKSTTTHSHGKAGEHSHAGTAFTTWLDMDQARQQALAIRDALTKAMPEHAQAYETNTRKLLVDLDHLDKELQTVCAAIGDRPIIASHPVYQYLARRYKLNLAAVLWEPETVPSQADLADLSAMRADHLAKWMIWEGEPADESVALLQAMGMQSVVFDPAGNRPDDGDWLAVMRQNVENLRVIADADTDGG